MSEKIVILANSRKLSGRCIAGKDKDGRWIRITKGGYESISNLEGRKYPVGSVIDIEGLVVIPSRQYNYHSENAIYARADNIGNLKEDLIPNFLDYPEDIFGPGRLVNEAAAQNLDHSLLFVEVQELSLYYRDYGQYGMKLRGDFEYNGIIYTDISLTDSNAEMRFRNEGYDYTECYDEAYITISLGEIFNGASYKLISGIIIP